jgi:hypothetical protein
MKKLHYIQPQTSIVAVNMRYHFLAGSNIINGDAEDTELNPETMQDGNGSDAASRRKNNVWDDEEEEW